MPESTPATYSRRTWLRDMLGLGSVWAAPELWAQTQQAAATDARLVVVFLRGAYDGLSALVPHGDANYYQLRSNIAIPKPDGTDQSALRLDAMFGLHPAMASVMPLWQQGVLTALPCAGSPDPTRSHFDAQRHWEIGLPGKAGNGDGWMNKLAAQQIEVSPNKASEKTIAISVGEANPMILAGSAPVHLVPKGQAATRQGAIGDARTREALMKLYAGQDKVSEAFRAGAESRMQTAETLRSDRSDTGMQSQEMQAANNGAGNARGLLLDAQHLGVLMRQDRRLRLGFLSAGGWDTHANQGGVTGTLAQNLGNLATALVQLRRDFSQPRDVVMVCSEFGRTCAENGTRGTDHGHGNALWIMGSQVQGGRWQGRWEGLANGNLHEGRDLPVHHDFRAVLAQVLRKSQGVGNAQLERLFPGFAWDAQLDSMLRT